MKFDRFMRLMFLALVASLVIFMSLVVMCGDDDEKGLRINGGGTDAEDPSVEADGSFDDVEYGDYPGGNDQNETDDVLDAQLADAVDGMKTTIITCVLDGKTPEEACAFAGMGACECWSDCLMANTSGDCGNFMACLARDCSYLGG